jgi:hypothetical protein
LQRGLTATARILNGNRSGLPKTVLLSSRHYITENHQAVKCHIAFSRQDEIKCFKSVGYEFPMEYKGVTVQVKVHQADLLLLKSALPEGSAAAADGGQELVEVLRFTGDIHTAMMEEGGEELAVYFEGSNLTAFAGWRIFAYEEVRCMFTEEVQRGTV